MIDFVFVLIRVNTKGGDGILLSPIRYSPISYETKIISRNFFRQPKRIMIDKM